MKYKFDVLVILNDDSKQVALDSIHNQLAHAEHIGKIFIGNTSLDTLQVIALDIEQRTLPTVKYTKSKSASGSHVTHSVHTVEKPIILGLRDAEFNVLKASPNPIVVIGTPDELNEPKTHELINSMQGPDKPVVKFIYVCTKASQPVEKYVNLVYAIQYLATLVLNIGSEHKVNIRMYRNEYDVTKTRNIEPITGSFKKSPNFRIINKAYSMILHGIRKGNKQKNKTVDALDVTQLYARGPIVANSRINNIVIVPELLLPTLINRTDLVNNGMFIIVITPENATQVTDLLVDNAKTPIPDTYGGRIKKFFKGTANAVFGSESSRRRRRTLKVITENFKKATYGRKELADQFGLAIKNSPNIKSMKLKHGKYGTNYYNEQKQYIDTLITKGLKATRKHISNSFDRVYNNAVKGNRAVSPDEYRRLEAARMVFTDLDKHIKDAQDEYDAKLKSFNNGVEQALAELDSKLSTAQKETNTATHALQEHQTAHGTNNNLTKKDVQIRLEVIATESDDAIDAMIKSLVNDTNNSINGLLRKFDVHSMRNVAMDNRQTFQKEAYALALEATAKVNSILNDKYNPVHVQKAVHEFHNTMDKFKQYQTQTIKRIQEYKVEIAARQETLNQEIPMVRSGLFGKKPDPVVAAEHKRLETENVALASKLAFEEYKLKMYTHITQAFVTLANVIIEIQAKLADRLAGIPDRQSKLEELNNALSELLKIQVARKTLSNTRNTAVKTETSLQRRKANIAAGKFANAPSLARRKQEANNAKAAIPELTPVDKQDIMLQNMQKLAKHISATENKLGSLSRKRRGAKWYQFGEKRTLKQQQAAKLAELSSLKRKQASIRRRQKEQVLG